jgi:large subunit ribosomal protein L19e
MKLQRRLAASIRKCGKNRIWLDPNETSEIATANSRRAVRKLISDGLIIRKPVASTSRFRFRRHLEAKRKVIVLIYFLFISKGRHTGTGKRQGTREARMPSKTLWMRRMRVLRRLLKKYREAGKVDKHLYRYFYMRVKVRKNEFLDFYSRVTNSETSVC